MTTVILSSFDRAPVETVPWRHVRRRQDGVRGSLERESDAGEMPASVVEDLVRQLNDAGGLHGADKTRANAIRLAVITRWLEQRVDVGADVPATARYVLRPWQLKKVTAHVDGHLAEKITLAGLAAAVGLSRMYFAAQFRAATGLRPHEFVLRRRIERAKTLLTETDDALIDIALAVGFRTQAHFTTVFRRFANVPPSQWRKLRRLAA